MARVFSLSEASSIAIHSMVLIARNENGINAGKIAEFARLRCAGVSAAARIDVLGPAEAPIARIKGRHRWQLLLMGKESGTLRAVVKDVLAGAGQKNLDIKVDVDPMNFM